MKICLKDEGRKRGGEEELTERGSGADGGLSSQIDSAHTLYCSSTLLLHYCKLRLQSSPVPLGVVRQSAHNHHRHIAQLILLYNLLGVSISTYQEGDVHIVASLLPAMSMRFSSSSSSTAEPALYILDPPCVSFLCGCFPATKWKSSSSASTSISSSPPSHPHHHFQL